MTIPSTPTPDSAGWIEWKGGECPVADHIMVSIERKSGQRVHNKPAWAFLWQQRKGTPDDIIAYRLSDRLADERSEAGADEENMPESGGCGRRIMPVRQKLQFNGLEMNGAAAPSPMNREASEGWSDTSYRGWASRLPEPADPIPSDQSAVAGAIELLLSFANDGRQIEFDESGYLVAEGIDAIRTLIADHAAQALRIKALEDGLREISAAWYARAMTYDREGSGDYHAGMSAGLRMASQEGGALLGSTEGRDDG